MKAINQIQNTDKIICDNIETFHNNRPALCENILPRIRTLVEHSCVFIIYGDKDFNQTEIYDAIRNSLKSIGKKGKDFKFLIKFHNYFQMSISHYAQNDDFSERLMLKYLECLVKLKKLFYEKYSIEILHNLYKFPQDTDTNLNEYYEKIYTKLSNFQLANTRNGRFYVWKVKPIFINNDLIYEITLSNATDRASKFQTFIVFSNFEIRDNYAIKAEIQKVEISIFNKKMPINLLIGYFVDIRSCEFNNFTKIFTSTYINCGSKEETKRIREYINKNDVNLLDIVLYNDEEYNNFKSQIKQDNIEIAFLKILDRCRDICVNKKRGSNILRYLLYNMKNRVIKKQIGSFENNILSNLRLHNKCIPFDDMPFVSSLINHKHKIFDLLNCIDTNNKRSEFFARKIKNNTENLGILYTDKDDLKIFGDLKELLNLKDKFNTTIYKKHINRKICEWNGKFFIKEYEDDAIKIIKELKNLAKDGLDNYEKIANSWLESYEIDDDSKIDSLRVLFKNSKVAMIYGAAGTGKSTLMNHISNLFKDKNKIFLAKTNPAVQNLKMKIELANHNNTMTIDKFDKENCDILFVDECSTVSNKDMVKILQSKFECLVLVGDNHQIKSIQYGSWFNMAKDLLSKKAVFTLTNTYRTKNIDLLKFWDEVRNYKEKEDSIIEKDAFGGYSFNLNNSMDEIFTRNSDDEIILCLNYGGLYGVNNLNNFLQISNKNPSFYIGNSEFKVGDPILFIENNFFISDLHNNLKGIIKKIDDKNDTLYFEVLIDKKFEKNHFFTCGVSLLEEFEDKSLVGFMIDKNINTDDDVNSIDIPFTLSYAVSIHKSQGLEYKSVKIIITKEVSESITHDIFYTAITRAKENLRIYWSPETQKKIINGFKTKNNKKDLEILKNKESI